jgi:chloramphenicol-sensitive protein RarD
MWLGHNGTSSFGSDSITTGLLIFSRVATAARRMSYTSLGFVQYLAPSIAFLLGVFVYNEPLSATKLACFVLIWTSIAIFCVDAIQTYRAASVEPK